MAGKYKSGKQRSVMTHKFSEVPKAQIQRSSFDRSFGHKTTFDAGLLIPIFVDEALPGDTFNLNMTGFARLATPLKPIMDNLFMETFFFFVPNRLLWDNWEKFNGAQDDPGDSTDFTIPLISASTVGVGTMGDYMGLPTATAAPIQFSVMWFRAYNLIWNEWFRDQNLQDSAFISTGDGPDSGGANYALRRRGKRHDYFTSCLPFPQKGASVDLPLGTSAPITHDGVNNDDVAVVSSITGFTHTLDTPVSVLEYDVPNVGGVPLYADLSAATAATINELRQAFQIQRLLERDARGGTRYTEIIKAHFGVSSPDARLQRPEYLGGGSTPVIISPIAQTGGATGATPEDQQGNLAAIGTAAFSGHGFTKSFTEHGVLLGLMSVRADLTYQQGMHRMFSRSTRFDFYWPALAHLGEQAVLQQEIFTSGTPAEDDLVFGYQERHQSEQSD